MRLLLLAVALLFGAAHSFAQNGAPSLPVLPQDPRGMLEAGRALYGFDDPGLKPWHLKGTYQLFNEDGNPAEQGSYEYWWVAPKVYRSTWTRPSGTRTEWSTAEGRKYFTASGDRILSLEQDLHELLMSPVPDISKLEPGTADIRKDQLKAKTTLPCAVVEYRRQKDGRVHGVPEVRAGEYCFDSSSPLLRVLHMPGAEYIEFDRLTRTQGRILAEGITSIYGAHKILWFSLDGVNEISVDDAALKPTQEAKVIWDSSRQSASASQVRLARKTAPVYPIFAKERHITGSVLIDALIGTDGKVMDTRVLASPSPLLTQAAKDAVAKWEYAPCLVDGAPIEVSTRITVIFAMN